MYKKFSSTQKIRVQQSQFINQNKINLSHLLKHLQNQNSLSMTAMLYLIKKCKHILNDQPNLLKISDPVLIIGDIHGQFFDFLHIIKYSKTLEPNFIKSNWKVLFLGDYVDRGINSIQVMTFIMALKIQYPKNIFLLRGNHQSQIMTQQYNFMHECRSKYNQQIYQQMMQLFNLLPIACIVNQNLFCVHGGISDKIQQVKQINKINRKKQIPLENSAFCDLIWSDPAFNQKGTMNKKVMFNTNRQCSIVYGQQLTKQFLKNNNFSCIIRGHQVFLQGYRKCNWDPSSDIPSVITIFSAPNYCGTTKNLGTVLFVENNNMKIKQFKQYQPQKYKFLTQFDAFSWTLPQILSNLNQITRQLLDSVISLKIPSLQKESYEKKMHILVRYALENNMKLFDTSESSIRKVSLRKKFQTEQEQRNYYFNKSHDYFAHTQKVPKH